MDLDDQELSNIIDIPSVQALMEDFYKLTHMVLAILDLKGTVLIAIGWQDICTRYHRVHPQTARYCTESDLYLARHVRQGEYVAYKCKNHMWDVVTPLYVGGKHVGNIYTGQFFYEDEQIDVEAFTDQAIRYSFDKESYLAALNRVPRFSRDQVRNFMDFLTKLSIMLSELSFSNLNLARSISEQRQIALSLQESEERFRSLFEKAIEGIFQTTLAGRIIIANSAIANMLGYDSVQELIDTITDIGTQLYTCPKEREFLIDRLALKGSITGHETAFRRKDGHEIQAILNLRMVQDKEGKPVYIEGSCIDISAKWLAEKALRKSEERYRKAQKIGHAGNWEYDLKTTRFWGSDEAKRIFGFSPERVDLSTDEVESCIPERERVHRALVDLVLEGKEYNLEYEIYPVGSTEPRIVWSIAEVQRDENDESSIITGVIQDITEQKRIEHSLLENEARLRTLVQTIPDLVWLKDMNGVFLSCNKSFERFLGAKEADIIGKTDYDFVDRKLADFFRENDRKAIEAGKPSSNEELLTFADDGSQGLFETVKTPMYDGTGRLIGVLGIARDITEKKRVLNQLKESEARYRSLFNNMLEGFAYCRMLFEQDRPVDFIYIDVNSAFERLTGLKNVVGKKVTEVIPGIKESNPDLFETYGRVALTGRPERFEIYAAPLPAWLSISVYSMEKGYFIAVFDNITERKRTEEALRESEARYRLLADNASDMIFTIDRELRFTYISPSVEKIRGFTVAEAMAQTLADVLTPVSFDIAVQVYEEDLKLDAAGLREPWMKKTLELEEYHKDGSIIWTETIITPLQDEKQGLTGFLGITRDITERKRAKADNDLKDELLRMTGEMAKVGGWEFDVASHKGTWTDAVNQIHDQDPQQDTNVEYGLSFYTHDSQVTLENALREVVESATPYDLELELISAKGTHKIVRTMGFPVMEGGKVVKVRGNIQDITDQKNAERERERLESQLFQAQKMEAIGTLAGGIAHDFNNILTALVGYAALLKMKMKDGGLSTYVDQILSASQKATDLIQGLLAFSRQQNISPKPVSIHNIIRGTEKLLKRLVTEDITIKTILAAEPITIMADVTQIDQILFNLATNARDAMPQGGTLTIETKAVQMGDEFHRFHGYGERGRYALLTISDTGMGMDEATRERIFDPFFTTKELGKGTGLGLSTVYGIVKQHNGHITVYSEPKMGTTFHIYLPAVDEVGGEAKPASVRIKGGDEIILVGEDNEGVRGLISRVLKEYGYTTIEAVDGEDAVEQFRKADRVDLLILDSVMPKKNGREAYDEIHSIKPGVKVIFTSGYTRDIFLDKGIEDKKFNFIQKPIMPEALLQKIREVLDEGPAINW